MKTPLAHSRVVLALAMISLAFACLLPNASAQTPATAPGRGDAEQSAPSPPPTSDDGTVTTDHDLGARQRAQQALEEWQTRLREQPTNVSVLFNAALDAARAGDLGYSRLYLERASVLSPFDREIRDTLSILKQAIGRQHVDSLGGDEYTEGVPDGIGSWRLTRLVPETISAMLLVGFLWAAFFGYLLYVPTRGRARRVLSIVLTVGALTLAALAAVSWLGARWTDGHVTPAIVVAEKPMFQVTPDELGRPQRSPDLYEGAMVAIEGTTESWLRVRLADERRVWVRDDVVRPVVPRELR